MKKRITNYVSDKIALIRAEKTLDENIKSEGMINLELLTEVMRLKKIFSR